MGLDITAYRKLEEVRPVAGDEDGYDEGLASFYESKDFPGRFEGLKEGVFYRAAEEHGFRAGSYSGYSAWRDWLAKLAGYPAAGAEPSDDSFRDIYRKHHPHAADVWKRDSGPFYELINFTDCDGTLGPVVAAKLAKDFAEYDERAKAAADPDWYYDLYCEWRKAMEMAADGGAVDFH